MKKIEFLYLTTIGRKSGKPREIEIWFVERQGRHYVLAEYETSNWVQNIRAKPQVSWRVGEQKFSGTARIPDPRSEAGLILEVQVLEREKYGWGDGLVVELNPG